MKTNCNECVFNKRYTTGMDYQKELQQSKQQTNGNKI